MYIFALLNKKNLRRQSAVLMIKQFDMEKKFDLRKASSSNRRPRMVYAFVNESYPLIYAFLVFDMLFISKDATNEHMNNDDILV